MEAIWTSVVAVAGTLLGAVITHAFQRVESRRGEAFARAESLRQERLTTFSAFAGAVEDYRRGQAERWFRLREDPAAEAYAEARDEAHRLRTVARQALYRVELLTADREVIAAAEHAYACARDVSHARDRGERNERDARARSAVEAFVARASPLVR
ncbi:hypothetical protein [Streptomyces cacaoi]